MWTSYTQNILSPENTGTYTPHTHTYSPLSGITWDCSRLWRSPMLDWSRIWFCSFAAGAEVAAEVEDEEVEDEGNSRACSLYSLYSPLVFLLNLLLFLQYQSLTASSDLDIVAVVMQLLYSKWHLLCWLQWTKAAKKTLLEQVHLQNKKSSEFNVLQKPLLQNYNTDTFTLSFCHRLSSLSWSDVLLSLF